MKLVWWMLAGSILSSYVITALLAAQAAPEVWLGMAGPLTAATASWVVMYRQHVRRAEGLTAVMIKAFALKMILFGGYVVAVIGSGLVRPIPFVISFTGYFLALHIIEAIGLRNLLQKSESPASATALRV